MPCVQVIDKIIVDENTFRISNSKINWRVLTPASSDQASLLTGFGRFIIEWECKPFG